MKKMQLRNKLHILKKVIKTQEKQAEISFQLFKKHSSFRTF